MVDMLDIAWGMRLKTRGDGDSVEGLRVGYFCDVSQGVDRKTWGRPQMLSKGVLCFDMRFRPEGDISCASLYSDMCVPSIALAKQNSV